MARKKKSTNRSDDTQSELAATEGSDLPGEEQSGALQGLSDVSGADSPSVRELAAEGNFFEAAVVSGIEDARPADISEVKTREVPADDVPPEYVSRDWDPP